MSDADQLRILTEISQNHTPLPSVTGAGGAAMAETGLGEHVRSIRSTLQMIDQQIAEKRVPLSGMDELKREIDNMRLRIWAIMAADAEGGGPAALDRFRLRRAVEMNHRIVADLESGELSPAYAELKLLNELGQRISRLVA